MIIRLRDAVAGDRFVAASGIGWSVLWNHDGHLRMVSDAGVTHIGEPPADLEVDVVNRDDTLTHAQALSNIIAGGFDGMRVVSTT